MANLELNMYVQNSTSGYDKLLPTTEAEKIAYVNTTSGLVADDVQSAIDELDTNVDGKAPTSHASSVTTYGVGSTTNYGHCKTRNDLTASSYTAGEALSAYQGKVLNDSLTNRVKFLPPNTLTAGDINYSLTYAYETTVNGWDSNYSAVGLPSGWFALKHMPAVNSSGVFQNACQEARSGIDLRRRYHNGTSWSAWVVV